MVDTVNLLPDGTPENTISDDWLKSLFGSTESTKLTSEGMFGNKETAGILPTSVDMASSAINAWLGYKQLGVAQDNTALQKEAFAFNKEQSNMEASLKLDAMQRGLDFHGVQSDTVDKYATQYQNK